MAEIRPILRWRAGTSAETSDDELADEEPLEIRVRGRAVSVTMRTPGHDDELAAGLLAAEGMIRRREDVLRIEPCGRNEDGNRVNVQLAPEVPVDFAKLTRHVFASSSCGLCGLIVASHAFRSVFTAIMTQPSPTFRARACTCAALLLGSTLLRARSLSSPRQ